jgi:DNA-binding XRE family transcriptional regulator
MNKRIEILLKEVNMSSSQFADAIGAQRATISHIITGRNNPSLDFVQKVLIRFPQLNPEWILNGKGDIWKPVVRESDEPSPARPGNASETKQSLLFDEFNEKTETDKNTFKSPDNSDLMEKQTLEKHHAIKEVKEIPNKTVSTEKAPHTRKIIKVITLYNDGTFEAFDQRW